MSEQLVRQILTRVHMREMAIAEHYTGFSADMQLLAAASLDQLEADQFRRRTELAAAYGLSPSQQNKPFAFGSGIAVIPVHGTLLNRFSYSFGYVTGYNFIRQQTALAGQDPDVLGIIYDHNSFGGEAAGCFECAADISRLANGKPTMAMIDSNCYSASYAQACGADQIVMTPSGGAGSIGVVAMHVSFEKMLKDFGLEITFIHAGAHKVDGNPFEALPDAVKADIQKSVNKSYAAFTGFVAEHRGLEDKAVRATEARTYRADDALSLGLIDAVATPSEAVLAFLGELSGSTSNSRKKDDQMSEATKPGATATAPENQVDATKVAADARAAERTRVSGIMGCDEAKGRESLANHIAMNTDMSLDDAKKMLAASPKADAAAPTGNAFKAHMDKDEHPNVGADPAPAAQGASSGDGVDPEALKSLQAAGQAAGLRGFAPVKH